MKLSLDIHGNVIKLNHDILSSSYEYTRHEQNMIFIVKLRQGSGKDRQGMALKLKLLPRVYIKVGCHPPPLPTHASEV